MAERLDPLLVHEAGVEVADLLRVGLVGARPGRSVAPSARSSMIAWTCSSAVSASSTNGPQLDGRPGSRPSSSQRPLTWPNRSSCGRMSGFMPSRASSRMLTRANLYGRPDGRGASSAAVLPVNLGPGLGGASGRAGLSRHRAETPVPQTGTTSLTSSSGGHIDVLAEAGRTSSRPLAQSRSAAARSPRPRGRRRGQAGLGREVGIGQQGRARRRRPRGPRRRGGASRRASARRRRRRRPCRCAPAATGRPRCGCAGRRRPRCSRCRRARRRSRSRSGRAARPGRRRPPAPSRPARG